MAIFLLIPHANTLPVVRHDGARDGSGTQPTEVVGARPLAAVLSGGTQRAAGAAVGAKGVAPLGRGWSPQRRANDRGAQKNSA